MKLAILFMLCAAAVLAQTNVAAEKKEVVAPAGVPKISLELRAKFWRAQAEALSAQVQGMKAGAVLDSVVRELTAVCGATARAEGGQDGELSCQPIPKPEQPKAASPAK